MHFCPLRRKGKGLSMTAPRGSRGRYGLLCAGLSAFIPVMVVPVVTGQPMSPASDIAVPVEKTENGRRMLHARHVVEISGEAVVLVSRNGGPTWTWRLERVWREGGATVPLIPDAQVSVADTATVCIERGWFIEQYIARAASVEQQFVIPRPLPGAGSLVIQGAVECDAAFERSADGWTWGSGAGAVRLGNVTVFDAAGRRLTAEMVVTADSTRITVDGAALLSAAYPVTVDPEIGGDDVRISQMGPDGDSSYGANFPTVAYNSVNDEFLVVWEGNNGAPLAQFELEIWGQRVNAQTCAAIGPPIRVSDMGPDSTTTYSASRCAVAYNSTDNEYLVVWRGDDNVGGVVDGEFEIFGQRIDAATGAEVGPNDFRISDMNGIGNTNGAADVPAVAYNRQLNQYLVVWHGHESNSPLALNEYEIFGQRLAANGAEVGANDFRISDAGPDGDTTRRSVDPDVIFNSWTDAYLVVWQADDQAVDNEFEVYGQQIDASTGTEIGSNDFRISDAGPDGDTNYSAYAPRVAFNSWYNYYLVVWFGDDNVDGLVNDEFEVFGQYLDGSTVAEWAGVNDFRISEAGPNGNVLYTAYAPAVAFVAEEDFLVTYIADHDVDGENEIYLRRLSGVQVHPQIRISHLGPDGDTNYDASEPRLAFAGEGGSERMLVMWRGDDDIAPLVNEEYEVFGQLFTSVTHTTITSIVPPNPRVGDNVVFNYSVTSQAGAPSGSVDISTPGGSCSGAAPTGSCTLVYSSAGNKVVYADYNGDSEFASSSDLTFLDVSPPIPTLTITGTSPSPSGVGQPVSVNFSVTSSLGTPTGFVTISDGTQTCTAELEAGSCTLPFATAGTRSLVATYLGDATFDPAASAPLDHAVNKADTVTTITADEPDPSAPGGAVNVTWSVTSSGGTPTGQVTVTGGTASCSAAVAEGGCALNLAGAGTLQLAATYAGDANFNGSTSEPVTHTVSTEGTQPIPDPNQNQDQDQNQDGIPDDQAAQCGACGAGAPTFGPLLFLGLVAMRRRVGLRLAAKPDRHGRG
jgi:hypothetical protein